MSARVICISRALGAGAEEAAAEVARELGFRCVDEEIVARAAERQNVDPELVASEEQRKSFFAQLFDYIGRAGNLGGVEMVASPHPGGMLPHSEDLRRYIRDAIAETAAQGNVVIVAHAASHALGARTDVLRVLVSGSRHARAGRIAASEGKPLAAAMAFVNDSDEARADYLERFYGVRGESPEHYDLIVSTDTLSPAQVAEVILAAARRVGPAA
ncbi:MAG TPA: cytidylate kinase family protein [Ramlibacter sp.]|uniref:cytidylate kinase-like family protein n=1 Tax=Ramlibacter sp. TaxID=1917967 RepID=UPI002B50D696|nr:cytidylate kinase family protein [Ramlibacter sp.]HVZ42606.1 cytidylate kinase family protein [Ramlibacter sp.]